MRSKSNEELQQELDFLYKAEQAQSYRYKVAYWMVGVGIVFVVVGWANYYNGSRLGILLLIGVVTLASGATGIWQERGKTKDIVGKIAVIRAVLSDRRR